MDRSRGAAVRTALAVLAVWACAVLSVSLPPSQSAAAADHPCAPLDIVFVLDTTGSMRPAIDDVQSEIIDVLSTIDAVSGGDYRIGLLDFSDRRLTVRTPFATRNAEAVKPQVAALEVSSTAGPTSPEMWDEALVTVVDNRTAEQVAALDESGAEQEGSFDVPWRAEAEKIVVLVGDSRPGGFDQSYEQADFDRAYAVSVRAGAAGIRVATVFIPHEYAEEAADD